MLRMLCLRLTRLIRLSAVCGMCVCVCTYMISIRLHLYTLEAFDSFVRPRQLFCTMKDSRRNTRLYMTRWCLWDLPIRLAYHARDKKNRRAASSPSLKKMKEEEKRERKRETREKKRDEREYKRRENLYNWEYIRSLYGRGCEEKQKVRVRMIARSPAYEWRQSSLYSESL